MKVGQRTKASVVIKCKRRRDGSQQGGGVLSGFVDSGNVEGGRDLQNQLFQHLIISRSRTCGPEKICLAQRDKRAEWPRS